MLWAVVCTYKIIKNAVGISTKSAVAINARILTSIIYFSIYFFYYRSKTILSKFHFFSYLLSYRDYIIHSIDVVHKSSTKLTQAKLRREWKQKCEFKSIYIWYQYYFFHFKLTKALFLSILKDNGIVVQLVRAPPCQGGSCGFETRQSRYIYITKKYKKVIIGPSWIRTSVGKASGFTIRPL